MQCVTSKKKRLNLVQEGRKRGGEGSIYRIEGQTGLVAKIYHTGKATADKRRKLEVMVANKPKRVSKACQLAWPKALLFDKSGQFIGFTMPAAKHGSDELCAFTHKNRRQMHHPQTTRRAFYRMAINLCHALEAVHSMGHVIGDFNPNNILCRENGAVTLIDTDSFSILEPRTGRAYRCEVGMNDYIAPEIQNRNRKQITWKKEHDHFALAVHLFQILMENRHPFAATPMAGVAPAEYAASLIAKGVYPHVRNSETKADYITDILPPELKRAFARTFVDGFKNSQDRLAPKEWADLLEKELKSLKQCKSCPEQFEAHAPHCPYCGVIPASLIASGWNRVCDFVGRAKTLPRALFFKITQVSSLKRVKSRPRRPKRRLISLRKKVLMAATLAAGIAVAFKAGLFTEEKAAETTPRPQVHTPPVTLKLPPVVEPEPNFPPLPSQKSAEEFDQLMRIIARIGLFPMSEAVVRQSPTGKFRCEYESPLYAHEDDALREFRRIKSRLDWAASRAKGFREVPIPKLHERFLLGCHFRSDRESFLVVIEQHGSQCRVVVIAQ